MTPDVVWRRNQFAVTAVCFIGFTGFTLVMPFLPLYIHQLGANDVGEIAMWAGLSLGVTPALTALLSPVWGRVADRFGRKLMVERALVSCALTMTAMAYVAHPWHIFALRATLGFFTGYGGLTLAMAAESAPRDRMASAIGMVQTAQRLGPALGPVVGGAVAGLMGIRAAFLVSAAFYVAALVLLIVLYREAPGAGVTASAERPARVTFRDMFAFQHFVLLMAVIFLLQFADRSFSPMLPLFVGELGVPTDRVALVSGVLFSVMALTAALGHHICGRLLNRLSAGSVIVGGTLLGSLSLIAVILVRRVSILAAAMGAFGFGIGAAMTAAYTVGASVMPIGARATGFGLLTGAALAGLAVSPMISGLLTATNIRAVFLLDVVLLLISGVSVRRATIVARAPQAAIEPVAGGE